MSDQYLHGIVPWFPAWLRTRAETRGGLTWPEIADVYGPDAAGLLYVVITLAHGRRVFEARMSDVLALIDMRRGRFNQVVTHLVQRGVIAAENDGDDVMEDGPARTAGGAVMAGWPMDRPGRARGAGEVLSFFSYSPAPARQHHKKSKATDS